MNFKSLSILFLVGICLSLFSCTNEDIMESTTVAKTNLDETAVGNTLKFVYKGNLYSSEYKYADADSSNIIVLDKETAKVWKSLANNANLAGFMHDDGVIEYFDDELERSQNMESVVLTRGGDPWQQARPLLVEAVLTCYENTDFSKREIQYKVKEGENYNVPDLSVTTSLNDKISSIRLDSSYKISSPPYYGIVPSATAIFYQHPNYGGVSLAMRVSYDNAYTEHHKLKKVSTPEGGNWNDKISSIKFTGTPGQ